MLPIAPMTLTVAQVASLARVSTQAVINAISDGRLTARQPGREWIIEGESARKYAKQQRALKAAQAAARAR